ncbi:bifunctional riboflavin kinase/FAD synthetase [Francisella frigiditurris]|uniref:Riboflavin biosynthesis protein n=1 Tax=Francisella frigiditurris TaxID=1542390 RepID=A0A1J0KSY4_9GAMM|nr:bifunctional riboflavin kinase/FAD synthetase [Francisella frigiditurris]APC96888.1 riboflavin biosynthesis protein RibF [Francisella frigiditurris]
MKVIRNLENFSSSKKSVVTIGSFDGVHLGHQSIINKLKDIANKENLTPFVIFFEPLPKEFFLKNAAPARIYSFRDKVINIKETGIENIICLKFDKKIINIEAEDFIKEFLVKKLKIDHILIGDDFKFGKDRKGDYDMLLKYSKKLGFTVDKLSTLNIENKRVSSSLIRNALLQHDLNKAQTLLGHNFKINGRVIHGQKNGRKLGFHTANLKLPKNSALKGVFLTKIYIDNETYFGVTNAGVRPTLDGKNFLLETHIFNFNKEIYKKHITVEILDFIRAEKKFNSFEELKTQINQDIQTAKRLSLKYTT